MSTKAKYQSGYQEFFDSARPTESVGVWSPVSVFEDFLGSGNLYVAADNTGSPWTPRIVGAAPPTVALVADAANGVLRLHVTDINQAQEAGLDWADERPLVLNQGLVFETRCRPHILCTGLSEMQIGLCGDYVVGPIASGGPAEHMIFVMDGSGAVVIDADDTANDNNNVATGVTLIADEYAVFRIDCSVITDIKFFINGNRVGAATTIDMSTVAALALQPTFLVSKVVGAGAGAGDLDIDYVRIWQRRA